MDRLVVTWHGLDDYMEISPCGQNGTVTRVHRWLSHDNFITLEIVGTAFGLFISTFSIVTNSINVAVFLGILTHDGTSVCFLAMSIADLVLSSVTLCLTISIAFFTVELVYGPLYPVDPFISVMVAWRVSVCLYMFYTLTILYIAVSRCLCVLRPVYFKHMFTFRRNVRFLVSFIATSFLIQIPLFVDVSWTQTFEPALNTTRWVYMHRFDLESLALSLLIVGQGVVPVLTEAILLVSVILMITTLRRSTRLRQTLMSGDKGSGQDKNQLGAVSRRSPLGDAAVESRESKPILSSKDQQVIQQVVLISSLYFIFTIPGILVNLASVSVPGFQIQPKKDQFATSMLAFSLYKSLFDQVNSSANIFIYKRYNNKYRDYVTALFFKKKTPSNKANAPVK